MLAISVHAASHTGLAPSRTSVRPGYTRGCAAFAHRRVDGKQTTDDDDVVAPTTRVDTGPSRIDVAAPLALLALASSVVPPSHASESLAAFAAFSSEGDAVERARDVLDRLETLPQIETIPLWLFVMTLSEMLPLFPSQPAALTSGIVFGATEGAAMVIVANMTAATLAFLAARGAGRALAEKVVKEETGSGTRGDETATGRYETAYGGDADDGEDVDNAFARKWAELRANLAESEPTRQATLIALYRLTPHPFSASNYLFGLVREVRLAPYLVGTCVGAIPYAILYAGAGAYGRTLLDGGEAFETAFAHVREIVESDLEIGEEGALAVGAATAAAYLARRLARRRDDVRDSA